MTTHIRKLIESIIDLKKSVVLFTVRGVGHLM